MPARYSYNKTRRKYDTFFTIYTNAGYFLSGSGLLLCQDGFRWNGTAPQCIQSVAVPTTRPTTTSSSSSSSSTIEETTPPDVAPNSTTPFPTNSSDFGGDTALANKTSYDLMDSLFSADEEASVLLWTSVFAAAAAAAAGCLICCYCCCCQTKKRKRLKEADGDGDEDKRIVNEDDEEELDFRLAYTSASASASSLDLLSHCNNRSSKKTSRLMCCFETKFLFPVAGIVCRFPHNYETVRRSSQVTSI